MSTNDQEPPLLPPDPTRGSDAEPPNEPDAAAAVVEEEDDDADTVSPDTHAVTTPASRGPEMIDGTRGGGRRREDRHFVGTPDSTPGRPTSTYSHDLAIALGDPPGDNDQEEANPQTPSRIARWIAAIAFAILLVGIAVFLFVRAERSAINQTVTRAPIAFDCHRGAFGLPNNQGGVTNHHLVGVASVDGICRHSATGTLVDYRCLTNSEQAIGDCPKDLLNP